MPALHNAPGTAPALARWLGVVREEDTIRIDPDRTAKWSDSVRSTDAGRPGWTFSETEFQALRHWNRLVPGDLTRPANRVDPHHAALDARIEDLRALANANGEPFHQPSAALVARFCHELAAEVRPALFLLPEGNLRAFWQNRDKEQIGVEALEDGELQFVLRHRGRRGLLTKAGTVDEGAELEQQVRTVGLTRLWFPDGR